MIWRMFQEITRMD